VGNIIVSNIWIFGPYILETGLKPLGLIWVKCKSCKKDVLWFTGTPLGPSICSDCSKKRAKKSVTG
jgi:hypothetical protein